MNAPTRVAARRAATIDEWTGAYDASEWATFFHGPQWARLWSEHTNGRTVPAPVHVTFEDGRTAVIGASRTRSRAGLSWIHLAPAGTYGGWVSADALDAEHHRVLAQEVVALGSVLWRRGPFDPAVDLHVAALPQPGGTTHLVDLRAGAAAARGTWGEKARGRVNRAVKAGVIVREAAGDEDWARYFAMYRVAVARFERATSLYPMRLFESLARIGPPGVRLFLAEHDGRLQAGALQLVGHGHATGWHQAALRDAPPGTVNHLHWEIIGHLADAGCHTYDLGPSGGNEGSAAFKARIGGVEHPAPICVAKSAPARVVGRVGATAHALGAATRRITSPRASAVKEAAR